MGKKSSTAIKTARRDRERQQRRTRTAIGLGATGIAAVALIGALFYFSPGATASMVPAWQAVTLDGAAVGDKAWSGDVYAVDFFYTWCPRCAAQYPHKAALVQAMEGRDDFHFISVNSDPSETPASIQAYKDKHGSDWPYVVDDTGLLTKFKANSRPYIAFVARDGRIDEVYRDITPGAVLIEEAERLLAEPRPAPAEATNRTATG